MKINVKTIYCYLLRPESPYVFETTLDLYLGYVDTVMYTAGHLKVHRAGFLARWPLGYR